MNKQINREDQQSDKIFDSRSLMNDYRTLIPILKTGMVVLDVGCGTGAISKDVAQMVAGNGGRVIGIDNTEAFIVSGRKTYQSIDNLELVHSSLFDYTTDQKFDLIISARVLQWLSNPLDALKAMKGLLKEEGIISILDYNHNALDWKPTPPNSMLLFYNTFLKWRQDAGMNNQIAVDLPFLFKQAELNDIEVINSDEYYDKSKPDFKTKLAIWSKVAASKQMVEEGYISDELRLKAIEEYNNWINDSAISMTMKLNEVRGRI